MQIIQSIREKGAAIIIIVIAISLIGFILMDSKSGTGNLFGGGNSTVMGKINGSEIERTEFNNRVEQEELKQQQQSGARPSGVQALQLKEQVWNQIVAENVFYKESEKLGITVTPEELSAILSSSDPSNPLLQQQGMTGPDGKIDPVKAANAIRDIKKLKGDERANLDVRVIEPLRLTAAATKYSGMISASAYYPKWMRAKDEADEKNFAVISYTGVAYNEISDSAVKVTDEDISAYVAKKPKLFKQEAGRQISYVSFSQHPSAIDSSNTKQQLEELKSAFAADTTPQVFTAQNSSAIEFKDAYVPVSKMTAPVKDTLVRQATNTVYGPYADGPNFVIAKIIGSKPLPDSVRARHILIPVFDRQTQEQIRPDSTAKQLADSILAAVKGGADFGALALKYSSDGSAAKGGDLGTFGYGQMVPEFNDFTFTKSVGDKDVVKTQFGYHVIDIVSQKDFKPAYKIAYVAKKVSPSAETIDAASLSATKASSNKTTKDLTAYAQKNGLKMIDLPGITIKENDFNIGDLQDARQLVQWIFKADAGDVSDPIGIGGDQFIVATVTKVFKEGTQDAQTARPMAEAAVRNQKKAAIITAKMGSSPTVESAATAYNKQPITVGMDSSITMASRIINGLGSEPKIIGASFNKEYQAKASPAIEGTTGVYVIKVNSIGQKASTADPKAQETARLATIRQSTGNWFEALRKQATIKDNRSKFF